MSDKNAPADDEREERAVREEVRRSLWSQLTSRFRRNELRRIGGMLEIWSGRRTPTLAEHQGWKGLFMPDLPSTPWLDPDDFAFVEDMRASLPTIQRELDALLRCGVEFAPYGHRHAKELPVPGWREHTFREFDQRFRASCRSCPETARLADRIAQRVGILAQCGYLVMMPGTRLEEHVDEVNYFVAVHMGLVVPARCGIRVGGKRRMHAVGKVLAFDNSFLHTAWNDGDGMRIVFSVYCSHPGLTPTEIEALRLLRPLMGTLSSRSPEPPRSASRSRGSAVRRGASAKSAKSASG